MNLALDHRLVHVKVYTNRAELTLEAKTHLEAGLHTLHLEGLSPYLDTQSFRLKAWGAGMVLGVQHKKVFREPDHPYLPDIAQLQQRAHELQNQLDVLADESAILDEERRAVGANLTLHPNEKGGHAAELKALTDFVRARLSDIAERQRAAQRQRTELSRQLKQVQQELEQQAHPTTHELDACVVRFEATEAGEFAFQLRYVATHAQWSPRYDLRVHGTDQPAELVFYAQVHNQTEVDWHQVPISLSTAQPTRNQSLPQKPVWRIDKYEPVDYEMNLGGAVMASMAAPAAEMAAVPQKKRAATTEDVVAVAEATLAVEYRVEVPHDIASGAKPTTLQVRTLPLPLVYEHYALPRFGTEVYLQGTLQGWGELNLLPGLANVFFEGDFVGETRLQPQAHETGLRIGLGTDPKVLLSYEELRDTEGKSLFGGTLKRKLGFEIRLQNTKKTPIQLKVEDILPVSRHSEVKVELAEGHGAVLDAARGHLTWQFALEGGKSRTLTYSFEVRHPKGTEVDWGQFPQYG